MDNSFFFHQLCSTTAVADVYSKLDKDVLFVQKNGVHRIYTCNFLDLSIVNSQNK